jgi:hypothetical protein
MMCMHLLREFVRVDPQPDDLAHPVEDDNRPLLWAGLTQPRPQPWPKHGTVLALYGASNANLDLDRRAVDRLQR